MIRLNSDLKNKKLEVWPSGVAVTVTSDSNIVFMDGLVIRWYIGWLSGQLEKIVS